MFGLKTGALDQELHVGSKPVNPAKFGENMTTQELKALPTSFQTLQRTTDYHSISCQCILRYLQTKCSSLSVNQLGVEVLKFHL